MSLSLYKLASEYKQVLDELSELDLDQQAINDTLEGLSGDLEQKAVNVAAFIKNLEAEAEAIKGAIDELSAKHKAKQKRVESLKCYLLTSLRDCGIKKVSSEIFTVSVRRTAPVLDVTSEDLIPADYFKETVVRKLDKTLVKQAISANYEVPGCKLIENEYLSIK